MPPRQIRPPPIQEKVDTDGLFRALQTGIADEDTEQVLDSAGRRMYPPARPLASRPPINFPCPALTRVLR